MKEKKCPLCGHKLIVSENLIECSFWRCSYKKYKKEKNDELEN